MNLSAGDLGHRHLGYSIGWTAPAGTHNAGRRTGLELTAIRHTGHGVQLHGPDGTVPAVLAPESIVTVGVQLHAVPAPELTLVEGRTCLLSRPGDAIRAYTEMRALAIAGWRAVDPELWAVDDPETGGLWIAFERKDAAAAAASAQRAAAVA